MRLSADGAVAPTRRRRRPCLKAAGYRPDQPVKAKIVISTAGSGQMPPLPMNEIIQRQYARPIGFD
jgi:peptide/nickel transport system substrate-binding protein